MIRKQVIFIICLAMLLAPNLWAAQQTIIIGETFGTSFGKSNSNDTEQYAHMASTLNPHTVTPTQLTLVIGTDTQAWDAFLDDIGALTDPGADRILFWDDSGTLIDFLIVGTGLTITDKTISATGGGSGDVSAAAVITDHSIVRGDGGAKGVQDSGVLIDDSDNVTGVNDMTVGGTLTATTGVAVGASADPKVSFDNNTAGNSIATIEGNSTGAYDIIMSFFVDIAGTSTEFMQIDGVAEKIDFLYDITLQAGSIILADLATDSVDYTKTTGSFKALTPVTDSAANFAANFTGANLYGGTFVCNVTGTIQLPAMLVNMNFTITTLGAIAVIVDTNVADGYLLDGVTGAEGANITNLSAAGDIVVCQYYTADDWLMTSNGWTAE